MRIVAFNLMACPAGWLGAYGNEWVGTPNLDRVAAEGIVFDDHISDFPGTEAAGRAWVTGRHQFPPIDGADGAVAMPPALPADLLFCLRAAGATTAIVRASRPENDSPAPFYAGWDEVFDARPCPGDDSPLDGLVRALPSILDKLAEVPRWLLWIEIDRLLPPWDVRQDVFEAYLDDLTDEDDSHPDAEVDIDEIDAGDEESVEAIEEDADDDGLEENEGGIDEGDAVRDLPEIVPVAVEEVKEPVEPVTPFDDPPTGPFDSADSAAREWLHRSFAAVVTSLDAELGQLFDELRSRGLDQTSAWAITSDMGYPLGERGQVGLYRPWLHEELVHLPFLFRLPGAAEAGRRVAALTQPIDLAPTILALLGGDPESLRPHGHNLLPLVRGEVDGVRHFACSGMEVDGVAEWAIRTKDWAYLLPGPQAEGDPPRGPQLYQKPDDRWEVDDLHRQQLERADGLAATLREWITTCSG